MLHRVDQPEGPEVELAVQKSETEILVGALYILSREVQSADGTANGVIEQGAAKIEELTGKLDNVSAAIRETFDVTQDDIDAMARGEFTEWEPFTND